jgi:DNA-binding PadR family transcriptional regulator
VIQSISNPGAAEERRPDSISVIAGRAPYTDCVPDNHDKRRRRDLDLFILALIEGGLSTPYDLKAADLSPGATIPALLRLVESGWVAQGKPGVRGRREYEITAEGRRRLKTGWRELIDEGPSGDLDADLRVALLALCVGGDRGMAVGFLRQAAAQRREDLEGIEAPERSDSIPSLAVWYRQLRSASASVLAKSESTAALVMAKALQKGASARTGWTPTSGDHRARR